jgi:D-amino peptidase
MKIYISADMEGVCGVVHSDQTDATHAEYQRFRKLMTAEVNAAVEGAFAGGATQVLVNDSHGGMRNILIEELHPEATLLSGATKSFSMMAGIDRSFDAVFFLGYHARAGTTFATLDHTWNGPTVVQNVWLNGVEVGESGLNAALAGYFGVPVVLVTGDQTACAQARELLGTAIETVVVKEAVGRAAAKNIHPTKAQELIRAAAERATKNCRTRAPFTFQSPITLRLALARSSQADRCLWMPGVKRVAPRIVEFTHEDYAVLYNAFRALMVLADVQV